MRSPRRSPNWSPTLIGDLNASIEEFSAEELNAHPLEGGPSIGFHVWHVLRTVDNIVNFVFHRDRPDLGCGRPRRGVGTCRASTRAPA